MLGAAADALANGHDSGSPQVYATDRLTSLARCFHDWATSDGAESHAPEPDDGQSVQVQEVDYYNGLRWGLRVDGGDVIGSSAVIPPFMAEMIGAGVVAADSKEAVWPAGNQRYYDVVGDGSRVDIKKAWYHREGVLGVPPAPAKGFNPKQVQEICLVELAFVRSEHEYLCDGTVRVEIWARARNIYRVPVEEYRTMTWPDGRSKGRSLVRTKDLEPHRVRSASSGHTG